MCLETANVWICFTSNILTTYVLNLPHLDTCLRISLSSQSLDLFELTDTCWFLFKQPTCIFIHTILFQICIVHNVWLFTWVIRLFLLFLRLLLFFISVLSYSNLTYRFVNCFLNSARQWTFNPSDQISKEFERRNCITAAWKTILNLKKLCMQITYNYSHTKRFEGLEPNNVFWNFEQQYKTQRTTLPSVIRAQAIFICWKKTPFPASPAF